MSDFWIGFGAGVFVMHCFWCAILALIKYAPLVDENELTQCRTCSKKAR